LRFGYRYGGFLARRRAFGPAAARASCLRAFARAAMVTVGARYNVAVDYDGVELNPERKDIEALVGARRACSVCMWHFSQRSGI